MKDNRIDALLRRDENTQAGLLADQAQYAPLEVEIGPLRQQHAANLAQAQQLEGTVLAEDQDDSAGTKTRTKARLIELATRLSAVLQAYAAGSANPDADLLARVALSRETLRSAEEGSFRLLVKSLLNEADRAPAAELTKREFTADELTETRQLLERFASKRTAVRESDVRGATARQTIEQLLKANTQLVKKIRQQLLPYKGSKTKNDVWLRFQGYTKVVLRGGGGGKSGGNSAEGGK